jgi:hypothetical protein
MKTTEWRSLYPDDPDCKERIQASYGFNESGSGKYFSITGTIKDELGRDSAFGCIHEDIARAFPELAELIKWHLVSLNGEPLHYIANAKYWLQKHLGIYRVFPHSEPEGRRLGEPEPLQAFKETIVFGVIESDNEKLNIVLASKDPIGACESWLNFRLKSLKWKMTKDFLWGINSPG